MEQFMVPSGDFSKDLPTAIHGVVLYPQATWFKSTEDRKMVREFLGDCQNFEHLWSNSEKAKCGNDKDNLFYPSKGPCMNYPDLTPMPVSLFHIYWRFEICRLHHHDAWLDSGPKLWLDLDTEHEKLLAWRFLKNIPHFCGLLWKIYSLLDISEIPLKVVMASMHKVTPKLVGIVLKLKYFVRSSSRPFATVMYKYCSQTFRGIQIIYEPSDDLEIDLPALFNRIRTSVVRKLAICGHKNIYWKILPCYTEPVVALVKGYPKNPSRSSSPSSTTSSAPSLRPEYESDVDEPRQAPGYVPRSPVYAPYSPTLPHYSPRDPWYARSPESGTDSSVNATNLE